MRNFTSGSRYDHDRFMWMLRSNTVKLCCSFPNISVPAEEGMYSYGIDIISLCCSLLLQILRVGTWQNSCLVWAQGSCRIDFAGTLLIKRSIGRVPERVLHITQLQIVFCGCVPNHWDTTKAIHSLFRKSATLIFLCSALQYQSMGQRISLKMMCCNC